MARRPRVEDWEAITARISKDSARRLRVAAARRGVTTGVILDEVISATLPADRQPIFRPSDSPEVPSHSIHFLKREMTRLDLSQSALSRLLGLTQKAVNLWFQRGKIPEGRWESILKAFDSVRRERAGK